MADAPDPQGRPPPTLEELRTLNDQMWLYVRGSPGSLNAQFEDFRELVRQRFERVDHDVQETIERLIRVRTSNTPLDVRRVERDLRDIQRDMGDLVRRHKMIEFAISHHPRWELTTPEAALLLGLDTSRVSALAREGRLPAVKRKGRWRFAKEFLEEWKELQTPMGRVREALAERLPRDIPLADVLNPLEEEDQ